MRVRFFWTVLAVLAGSAPALPAEAQGACTVSGDGVYLEPVVVRPPGAAEFRISVRGARVSTQLPQRAHRAEQRVAVRGSLEFEGFARPADVPYQLAQPVDVRGILSAAAPGDWMVRRPTAAAAGAAHVELMVPGFVLRGSIVLPCTAIAVGAPDHEHPDMQPDVWPNAAARRRVLRVHAEPRSPAWIEVVAAQRRHPLPLEVMQRRLGWSQVRHLFSDGSELRGWVRSPELVAQSDFFGSGSGDSRWSAGRGSSGSVEYAGPALVALGAPVFANVTAQQPWATASGEQSVTVTVFSTTDRADITSLPDLLVYDHHLVTWVARTALDLGVSRQTGGLTLREELDSDGTRRKIVVTEVEPGTPAAQSGLAAGDQIVELHGTRGARLSEVSLDDLRSLIGRGGIALHVRRGGSTRTVEVPWAPGCLERATRCAWGSCVWRCDAW